MLLNKPVLLITSSPSLVKIYLQKNFPGLKFKITDSQDDDFEHLVSLSKSKNLFGQKNFYLIIKNFFIYKKEVSWPEFFVIWEEKFPKQETFNFWQRKLQFNCFDLETLKDELLKDLINSLGLQIKTELLKQLQEMFFQDNEGFEALFHELTKLQSFSSKITDRVISELFYPPFWIKNTPIWENLHSSVAGNFFKKDKKGFLNSIKKALKQNVPLEIILGEIHLVLKNLVLKKIFGSRFLPKEYFNFLHQWSYQELKNLSAFLAESDLRYKRHVASAQEILEKLAQTFL